MPFGVILQNGRLARLMVLASSMAGLMVAMVALAGPARAENFWTESSSACGYNGGPGCVSMANNHEHSVRRYQLGDWVGIDGAVTNAIPLIDSEFALHVYESSTDNQPDVRLFDSSYGNTNWFAITDCTANNTGVGLHNGTMTNRWCRGQDIRFNASYRNDPRFSGTYTGLVMHEMGHTVGLQHRDTGGGAMKVNNPYPTFYTDHDKNHISSFAPYN